MHSDSVISPSILLNLFMTCRKSYIFSGSFLFCNIDFYRMFVFLLNFLFGLY